MLLYNADNLDALELIGKEYGQCVDVIYADCIYENKDYTWLWRSLRLLKPDGVVMVQTDHHTVADYYNALSQGYYFVNWLIYKQEWGGISRRYFPRKHDDILVFAKNDEYKFYPERVLIPKATAGTALDKRGDGMKIPCDVFDDLGNFHTMDKERIKGKDGKNIQWQKPLKLMNRLLLPFTDEQDIVLDPFMGTGTTGVWCERNDRRFIGIEQDPEIYEIALERFREEVE
jgi:site-specific DNA-methyltransferase (adenine-specific)